MKKLSVTIVTKDEEKNIRECLESVKWADEVIVVDDMSSDRTVEIAREYTNKIFKRKLDNFSNQKNFGQEKASSEWILQVDADERVTSELKEEILKVIASKEACGGYHLSRKQYFFGKWIKYGGWYPDYQLRLYRKNKGKWYKPLHERVKVEGKTGTLTTPLVHYIAPDIATFTKKNNLYTSLQARIVFELGDRERWYKPIIFPVKIFFQKFFLLRGFRDGYYGFVIAVLSAFYTFTFRAKLWELYRRFPKKREERENLIRK